MRRAGVAALIAVLVAGAAIWGVRWATRGRDMPASVPSPHALVRTDLLRMAPGRAICAGDVTVDPRAAQARFLVATFRRPGPPLTFSLRGEGYAATARVPAGYGDNSELTPAIPPPPRAVLARACVRNDGRHSVVLYASTDQTLSRSVAVTGGKSLDASYWLSFYEPQRRSVLERLSATLQRITVFRPGIVGRGLLWVLLALVVVGIPLGIAWAWRWALTQPASSQEANASPSTSGTASRGTA